MSSEGASSTAIRTERIFNGSNYVSHSAIIFNFSWLIVEEIKSMCFTFFSC